LSNLKWYNIFVIGTYILHYYTSVQGDNPVDKFLDSLSEKQQAKILRVFQYIQKYGLTSILPHTKKISGTPLWEIRILGQDNIRTIYAIFSQNTVVIFHGFIKKKQKTPLREINIALSRYQEWKLRHIDK